MCGIIICDSMHDTANSVYLLLGPSRTCETLSQEFLIEGCGARDFTAGLSETV